MKYMISGILALILIAFLVGCGQRNEDPDDPALGAQEWIDAITNQDGNKILKYTCLAQREDVQETFILVAAFSAVGEAFTLGTIDIDFEGDISDLKFETITQEEDQADVRVYGELRVSQTRGVASAFQVDETWHMVRENDTWRWCNDTTLEPTLLTGTGVQDSQIAGNTNDNPAASSVAASATQPFTVLNQREVNLSGVEILKLSPDGKRFAVRKDKALCIYEASSQTEERCVVSEVLDERIAFYSIAWSPDGTKIAFTEDALGFRESDIWVFDVESGGLTDLTDDGVTHGAVPGPGEPEFTMDAAPAWSPDGQRLNFIRTLKDREGLQGTELFTLVVGDDSPEKLVTIDDQNPMITFYQPVGLKDNQTVYYTVDRGKSLNGVWKAEGDNPTPRRLLDTLGLDIDPEAGTPVLLAISEQENIGLIRNSIPGDFSYFALVDLDTGEATPSKRLAWRLVTLPIGHSMLFFHPMARKFFLHTLMPTVIVTLSCEI